MICKANQGTGFYMTGIYIMKELKYFPDTSSFINGIVNFVLKSRKSRCLKVRDLFEFQQAISLCNKCTRHCFFKSFDQFMCFGKSVLMHMAITKNIKAACLSPVFFCQVVSSHCYNEVVLSSVV